MKLGIISDTHGDVELTARAVHLFQMQRVDQILHCGDIGSREVVHLFEGEIPTGFVFGNCDLNPESLKTAILEIGQQCMGWFGELEMDGKHISFLHGDRNMKFEQELAGGRWDLMCFGHTHVAHLQLIGSTLLLNPGAIHRTPNPSVAVVELETMDVSAFAVS